MRKLDILAPLFSKLFNLINNIFGLERNDVAFKLDATLGIEWLIVIFGLKGFG